jgi:hypothetical protein
MLQMDYESEGGVDVGEAMGAVSLRVEGALTRFKEFIETRGRESAAWRGKVKSE